MNILYGRVKNWAPLDFGHIEPYIERRLIVGRLFIGQPVQSILIGCSSFTANNLFNNLIFLLTNLPMSNQVKLY